MLLHIPSEDADLVKIVGKPILVGIQNRQILRHLMIGKRRCRIVDRVQDISADHLLALGIAADRVGNIHIQRRANSQPA